MKTVRRRIACVFAALLATLCSTAAVAQQDGLTDREKQLLSTIEALNERVMQLEQKVDEISKSQPAAAPDLTPRLEAVEKKFSEKPKEDFRVFWKDGIRFETSDKQFKLRLSGRLHHDYGWFKQSEPMKWIGWAAGRPTSTDAQDGVGFRRARLQISGDLYDNVEFKAQYDFAGDGTAKWRDVFVGLKYLPYVGTIRVGNQYEPFGLEQQTSSNALTFLERGMPVEAFSPDRNTGVRLQNAVLDNRMTWSLGLFQEDDNYGTAGDEDRGWNATGRITGLPWYADEGRQALHLGLSYSHQNPDGALRYRARPEVALTNVPRFIDTRNTITARDIRADQVDLYGLEAALVYGPFSLQSEYYYSNVDSSWYAGDLDFSGYYVYASYFLTGEHRQYSETEGIFASSLKPLHNFNYKGTGWGAWEVALRYSSVDLNSGPIYGGTQDDITAGINWYLNPSARIMLNYVHGMVDHPLYDGDFDSIVSRFQIAF